MSDQLPRITEEITQETANGMILPVRSSSPTPAGMRTRERRAGGKRTGRQGHHASDASGIPRRNALFKQEGHVLQRPQQTCVPALPERPQWLVPLSHSARGRQVTATPGTQPMTRRDQSCPRSINPLRAAQLHPLPLPILSTLPNAHSPSHTHPQHTQHTLQRDL